MVPPMTPAVGAVTLTTTRSGWTLVFAAAGAMARTRMTTSAIPLVDTLRTYSSPANSLPRLVCMPTREQITEALTAVIDPELRQDIVTLGMVRAIDPREDGS